VLGGRRRSQEVRDAEGLDWGMRTLVRDLSNSRGRSGGVAACGTR
jgi:hypothetical protein